MTYQKIEQKKYNKLLFQARGQYIAILNVFNCYGLNPYVDIAVEECLKVAENFAMAVRGKDIPIHILGKPKRRALDD